MGTPGNTGVHVERFSRLKNTDLLQIWATQLSVVAVQVRDWYVDSFQELRDFPSIKCIADESKFTELLRNIYRRHANVVPTMAKGVADLKTELNQQAHFTELPEIHQFLDGFYMSRIGIRILIGAALLLSHSRTAGSRPSCLAP